MKPTDTLIHEHKVIKRALNILDVADQALASGDDSVVALYPELIEFIRGYADSFHHAKEEDILFQKLGEKGMPIEGGPVSVMLSEHEHFRFLVGELEDAVNNFLDGDDGERERIIENADEYVDLLRGHIEKEDSVLYPMSDNLLTEEDQQTIQVEFEKIEEEPQGRQDYEEMIAELEKRLEAA